MWAVSACSVPLDVSALLFDYRSIEFVFGKVPSSLKGTVASRKVLLKKLCGRVLPPEFDQQRKQDSAYCWLIGWKVVLGTIFFQDVLLGAHDCFFAKEFVRTLLDSQKKRRANSERLFALVLFELWCKEHRVS